MACLDRPDLGVAKIALVRPILAHLSSLGRVDGSRAHTQGAGDTGLILVCCDTRPDLGNLLGRQGGLAPTMLTRSFGSGHAFPLTLPDHGKPELRYRPYDGKLQVLHGVLLACEGKRLLVELRRHASTCQVAHQLEEVGQISGKSIHGVNHKGIALADEIQAGSKARPFRGGTGAFVLKLTVKLHGIDPISWTDNSLKERDS